MENKKIGIIVASSVVVLVLILGIFLQKTEPAATKDDTGYVSKAGLHWHPELSIIVKGVKQEIPADIGMVGTEMPIHTHDATGVIHLEFSGVVRVDDLKLGEFFKVWGKDIRSFGTNMKMTVNGIENTEFENYHMKDGDKIVLNFD